nr:PREDICTED: WD repeat-containing protein DDB_G0290555-like [Musa acuminata subsp. malaccensis]
MPRTSALECPGCPPLRALTTDVLGLVKVVEAHGKTGIPKVVETWGQPDASSCVLAASYSDRKTDPLLAVARKNGLVECLNPINGEALGITKIDQPLSLDGSLNDDRVVGLHLFKTKGIDVPSRSVSLLTCLEKGNACLRSIPVSDAPENSTTASHITWNVCSSGKIICSSVDKSENYALFGGKGIELNMWDLGKCSKIWSAKSPPSNRLGIFSPTWFTAATFLSEDDHRKVVAGTNNLNHQVRLYDTSAQRRPVISVDFRDSPIKAVCEDLDGYTVYVGNGSGDLASFDMRTGKLMGCFIGKCSGSIRSIARHPEFPVIASCGLDSYLRVWDAKTRQLLSAVFLKQHLTNVVIDSHFSDEGSEGNTCDQQADLQVWDDTETVDNDELPISSGEKASKRKRVGKVKKRRKTSDQYDDETSGAHVLSQAESEVNSVLPPLKQEKSSDEHSKRRFCHEGGMAIKKVVVKDG